VAVENARGLLLSCLRATGRVMYSINPMAVSRYRERHRVARAKSDHDDAVTWRTSCASTRMSIVRCRTTRNSLSRSPCWPVPSRTRCGTAFDCRIS
jgi:hypothetical protein